MRWLVTLSLVAGCTDGIAPPVLVNDDLGVPDASEEDLAVEDSGGPVDLSGVDFFGIDLSPAGTVDMRSGGCATACDCPSGQACIAGACSASVQVFCCGTAGCTGANTCQGSDGRISQCSAPPDAGVLPDAGSSGGCVNTACTPGLGSQLFCSLACGTLTASCSGSTMKCQP